uniref:Uncharacterized protein n=1 Tax=Lepeophtheirus salmonis TaxID=72036 RepID=A0A0K2T613_LEPSM
MILFFLQNLVLISLSTTIVLNPSSLVNIRGLIKKKQLLSYSEFDFKTVFVYVETQLCNVRFVFDK